MPACLPRREPPPCRPRQQARATSPPFDSRQQHAHTAVARTTRVDTLPAAPRLPCTQAGMHWGPPATTTSAFNSMHAIPRKQIQLVKKNKKEAAWLAGWTCTYMTAAPPGAVVVQKQGRLAAWGHERIFPLAPAWERFTATLMFEGGIEPPYTPASSLPRLLQPPGESHLTREIDREPPHIYCI